MNFGFRREVYDFILRWEGNRLTAYKDVVGRWTIGVGIIDPKYAFEGNTITAELSERLAIEYIHRDIEACNQLIKVPTSPEQQTAILSFCYNFGIGRFRNSTMLKKLNQGKYIEAYQQFPRWVHGRNPETGQMEVLRGLVNRRKAEADLFLKGTTVADLRNVDAKEGSVAKELESNVDTPTTTSVVPESPPTPTGQKAGAALTAGGAALTQTAQLEAVKEGLAPVAHLNEWLSLLFVGVTLLGIYFMLKKSD